jgi:hypothetical protein
MSVGRANPWSRATSPQTPLRRTRTASLIVGLAELARLEQLGIDVADLRQRVVTAYVQGALAIEGSTPIEGSLTEDGVPSMGTDGTFPSMEGHPLYGGTAGG